MVGMLDYDAEAARYDDSRGGLPRATAAAEAAHRLLGDRQGPVIDIAGGTGIVTAELAAAGHQVLVADLSHGMLRIAQARLAGRAVRADVTRLPVRDGSVGAVMSIWLLHLLEPVAAALVVSEAARVLRPAGRYLTTVDKDAAQGKQRPHPTDRRDLVEQMCRNAGLLPAGETTFVGHGQGASGRPDPCYTVAAFER